MTLDPTKLGFDVVASGTSNGDNTVYAEVYYWHTNGVYYRSYQYKYCLTYNNGGFQCGKYGDIFPLPWRNSGGTYNTPFIVDSTLSASYAGRSCP